jgi:hypothetical protein
MVRASGPQCNKHTQLALARQVLFVIICAYLFAGTQQVIRQALIFITRAASAWGVDLQT